MTGVSRLPAVDFANANYLLSFNANLFETFLSPVRHIYSYGQMRQGRPGHSRQVRAGGAASVTDGGVRRRVAADQAGHRRAARARDGARDRQREALRRGVRRAAAPADSPSGRRRSANYAPETIAPQIDVPAASIQRVAREFAQRRPSVAVGDSRDVASLTAIYALNALVGAFGKPGGILLRGRRARRSRCRSTGAASGVRAQSPKPRARSRSPDILGLMAAMGSSQVKALLVLDTNPLFTLPEADKLRSALGSVPFVASFASFLDETSAMADLILPSHVTLERWVG